MLVGAYYFHAQRRVAPGRRAMARWGILVRVWVLDGPNAFLGNRKA